jgi:hypothetical protein
MKVTRTIGLQGKRIDTLLAYTLFVKATKLPMGPDD